MPSRAHESQLLSLCATTTEARGARACPPQIKATTMRSLHTATKNGPQSLQVEKADMQQ